MQIRIGHRVIGDAAPCFIIAEAGSNHNGSLEQAKRLIDVAASAGADAVKFQLFRAERLYPKSAGASDYLKTPRPIYDIIHEMEMSYDWLPELQEACRKRGVFFMASVFDEESADRLDPFVEIHKIASYEMTHVPLLRHVARKGKPTIVSTGTANLEEVRNAVETVRAIGNKALILMQCTAAYPAPLESLNVRAIVTFKQEFGVPAGLSDHSRDPLVGPMAAVAVGANLLEKHFTLSNRLPGPDHAFAVEPKELGLMVKKIREAEQALGSGEKAMHPIEQELQAFARRYLFAIRRIQQGEPLTRENVRILRKGKHQAGLPPQAWDDVLGRRVARTLEPEEPIQARDLI